MNRMFDIAYGEHDIDSIDVLILLEVTFQEIATAGRDGLTPAVLARAHKLSPETARRRLRYLVDDGWVDRRDARYFLPEDSDFRDNFDKIVHEFERYGNSALM